MKRFKLNFKQSALLNHHSKLVIILAGLFAFSLSTAMTADAQRRGGGIGMRGGFGHSYIGNYRNFGGHFSRSVPFWSYPYFPVWGDFYWGVSPLALRFLYNDYYYYFDDGVYYRLDKNKYQVVPAPVGHKIKTLPTGTYQFSLDGATYFYYYGTYYIPVAGQYEVVQPPIGATVESIPQGYEKLEIEGQTYYILNEVQYKAVIRNNEVWYQVIKNNSGNAAPANSSKEMNAAPTDNR